MPNQNFTGGFQDWHSHLTSFMCFHPILMPLLIFTLSSFTLTSFIRPICQRKFISYSLYLFSSVLNIQLVTSWRPTMDPGMAHLTGRLHPWCNICFFCHGTNFIQFLILNLIIESKKPPRNVTAIDDKFLILFPFSFDN